MYWLVLANGVGGLLLPPMRSAHSSVSLVMRTARERMLSVVAWDRRQWRAPE